MEKPSRRRIAAMVAVLIVFSALSAAGFIFLLDDETLIGQAFILAGVGVAGLWWLANQRGWFR